MQQFAIPGRNLNSSGNPRRVGFELEFAGIELSDVANVVADQVGGTLDKVSEAEFQINNESLGTFRVELDWTFAKETAQERLQEHARDDPELVDVVDDPVMKWVTRLAGTIVPIEIVCPPIPIDELKTLNGMVSTLRKAGALGTGHNVLYAFGLHLNPELPNLAPSTISGYLQAFTLTRDWLIKRHNVDFSRRVTPYIDHYPAEYEALVMEYDENLSQEALIADYLAHNATRNRALDLLPLLKHIDAERVGASIADPRINSRPTFHYRLPNCDIEQPNWSLAESWNLWCVVEHLAEDDSIRSELVTQWRDEQEKMRLTQQTPWQKTLDSLHQDLLSA